MTMERYILPLLFAVASLTSYGQVNYKRPHNQMLDQAKALLAAGDHAEALKIYKRLLPVDPSFVEVGYEAAMCMVNLPAEREGAAPLLERAVEGGHVEAHMELARLRHREMRFDEAIALYDAYKKLNYRMVKDDEVDRLSAMSRQAKVLVASPVDVQVRNLGATVNSEAHDYCPMVTSDGTTLYFTSRRPGTLGGRKDAAGQYFEDIYMTSLSDGIWGRVRNIGQPVNTVMHDATVGLDPNGDRMIIYRTQPDLVSGDLYEVSQRNGQWEEPVQLTSMINSDAHEPSATIAPGGEEIYFTSDRVGGFGGRDLYRIRRLPNGEWSLPLNLGPGINTPYDEDAPFMHSDGITLFFSSNGHATMGGYDVFKATLMDADMNGWSAPENMGYPLNTVNDDIYFSLGADGHTGYFSSERSGGLGLQDIYEVAFPTSQIDYVLVRGMVTDTAEQPLRARITLMDRERTEVFGVYNTNASTGRYIMVLTPGVDHALLVESPGFAERSIDMHADASPVLERELLLDVTLVRPATADSSDGHE
jgi:hypothetical protein